VGGTLRLFGGFFLPHCLNATPWKPLCGGDHLRVFVVNQSGDSAFEVSNGEHHTTVLRTNGASRGDMKREKKGSDGWVTHQAIRLFRLNSGGNRLQNAIGPRRGINLKGESAVRADNSAIEKSEGHHPLGEKIFSLAKVGRSESDVRNATLKGERGEHVSSGRSAATPSPNTH